MTTAEIYQALLAIKAPAACVYNGVTQAIPEQLVCANGPRTTDLAFQVTETIDRLCQELRPQ